MCKCHFPRTNLILIHIAGHDTFSVELQCVMGKSIFPHGSSQQQGGVRVHGHSCGCWQPRPSLHCGESHYSWNPSMDWSPAWHANHRMYTEWVSALVRCSWIWVCESNPIVSTSFSWGFYDMISHSFYTMQTTNTPELIIPFRGSEKWKEMLMIGSLHFASLVYHKRSQNEDSDTQCCTQNGENDPQKPIQVPLKRTNKWKIPSMCGQQMPQLWMTFL